MDAVPAPPSAEERSHFFFGLPTQPVLVARTDCISSPWTRPVYSILGPVNDVELVRQWKEAVGEPFRGNENLDYQLCTVFANHNIDWTFYVPFITHGRRYLDVGWEKTNYPGHPKPADKKATYLVIGVHKDACTWPSAFSAATECRRILAERFANHDIEVLLTEMDVLSLTSPPRDSVSRAAFRAEEHVKVQDQSSSSTQPPPASGPKTVARQHHTQNPLFEEYNFLFDEIEPESGGRYRHYLFPDMRNLAESVVRFLPFPGQVVQPLRMDGNKYHGNEERPRGSIGLYIRLASPAGTPHDDVSDNVYALTSRHVAIGGIYDHRLDFRSPASELSIVGSEFRENEQNKPPTPAIALSWGSNEVIREHSEFASSMTKDINHRPYQRRRDMGMLVKDDEILQLRLAENFVDEYAPRILSLLDKEWQDPEDGGYGTGAAGRVFGHVELAGRVGITKTGFVRNWALTRIIPSPHGDTNAGIYDNGNSNGSSIDRDPGIGAATHLPAPPARPPLFTNNIFVGLGLRPGVFLNGVSMRHIDNDDTRRSAYHKILENLGPAGFLNLKPIPTDYEDQCLHPQYVAKRGFMTGVTMGVTSPILAVTRRPGEGLELPVARLLPVLTIPPALLQAVGTKCIAQPPAHFSIGGDSGSAIFDSSGHVIAMLEGGARSEQGSNPTIVQSAEKHMAKDWEVVDVTFATPMAAVFEDIRHMTGLEPSLV